MSAVLALAAGLAACGAFDAEPTDTGPGGGPGDGGAGNDGTTGGGGGEGGAVGEGGVDAGPGVTCSAADSFKMPEMITAPTGLESARIGVDGLVYVTTPGTALGTASLVNGVVSAAAPLFLGSQEDEQPMLSPSGLFVVFDSKRSTTSAGAQALLKLWFAKRPNTATPWPAAR